MKRSIIFLSIFVPFLLLGFDLGFGKEYYSLAYKQQREIFIATMSIMLDKSFEKVQEERLFVEEFLNQAAQKAYRDLELEKLERLVALQKKYRVGSLFDLKEYQKRINIVPKSMGIAQALIESGTGTSRFTKEANNLFGEWTWGEKGLIPRNRPAGQTHKIRIFDSLQDSVDSYVLNLNRNHVYENFRTQRLECLRKNEKFTGIEAIQKLEKYSQTEEYSDIIIKVIKQNELEKYDQNPSAYSSKGKISNLIPSS